MTSAPHKTTRWAKTRRWAGRKEIRYLAVGGWNTVFGFLAFVILQLTIGHIIGYMAVLVIAQVLSVVNAYVAYRLLVFRVSGRWVQDFFRFSAVYWIVFLINLIALPVMVSVLGMNVLVAQSLFFVVTVTASYFAHNHFSFRRAGHE
jgi:putative flippase GtrA